jgi:Uma2 family endonuclease
MAKTALQLGPDDAGAQLTAEEFAGASYEPPFIYERVKGRLVVMSPAGSEHRFVSRPFRRVLGGYWSANPDVIDDVDVEGWVSTSNEDDRIPDICVYLSGASSSERVPRRVPDLIFEFVSANRSDQERDYIDKRAEYHSIGVKEYVIVDRFKQAVLVLTWKEQDFVESWLRPGDAYTTPLLQGLRIELSEAFE